VAFDHPALPVACAAVMYHLGAPKAEASRNVDPTTMQPDPSLASPPAGSDASATAAAPIDARMRRRVVFASILGNGLEWFDFVSYGYFASIIAKVFFPAGSDHSLALMLTYATFAIGFVVRPIGGILLGAYADRYGRRRALSLLIVMMAFGTLTLGLTPSYASIGILAPIIVVLGRVVQGISIGGEYGSATALLVEYAPPNRRMMYGSFQMSSQALGRVLATGIGLPVLLLFSADTIQAGAWRIPFLIGSLIGPFGFYVRYRLAESPEFERLLAHKADVAKAPVREVLQHHWVPVITAIGLTIIGTSLTYIWNTYLPTYVVEQLHLPLWQGLFGVTVTSALGIGACVFGGYLADVYGAYRTFFLFTAISAVISYPMLAYVLAEPGFGRLFTAQFVVLMVFGLLQGSGPGLLAGLFPVSVRSTGMAISYNIGVTVFGGFAPLTVTSLIATTGNKLVPAFYIIAAAVLSMVTVGSTLNGLRQRAAQA
jgi:MFS transporter, MHS family, proline/betaine transporter